METFENTWDYVDELNNEELMELYKVVNDKYGVFDNCVFYTFDELLKMLRYENGENVLFMLRNGDANLSEDEFFQITDTGIYSADTWDIDEYLCDNEKRLCEFLVKLTEEQLSVLSSFDNMLVETVKQDKGME